VAFIFSRLLNYYLIIIPLNPLEIKDMRDLNSAQQLLCSAKATYSTIQTFAVLGSIGAEVLFALKRIISFQLVSSHRLRIISFQLVLL
jgi:hypothetical protein